MSRIGEKVLFVDDDARVLEAYERSLRKVLDVRTAKGGKEGLALMAEDGPFAVIVSDLRMPQMDGIEFLAQAKKAAPDSVRMMLTGNADVQTAIQSVNEGSIFRFLTKPCPPEVLIKALIAGIEQYRLVTAEKELLDKTLKGSIKVLMDVLSMVSPEAFGRATRLRETVRQVAGVLTIGNLWELELASLLCQLGYVAIPPELVSKTLSGKELSQDEIEMIARVPEVSHELIKSIPRLDAVARVVLYHDKRYDGGGYPQDSVAGQDLPLEARILKILVDLEKARSRGIEPQAALHTMRQRKGWYDPGILDDVFQAWLKTTGSEADEPVERVSVSQAELRIGDMLTSAIETIDGKLLIAEGNTVSQVLLARLRNYSKMVVIKEPIRVVRPLVRPKR